MFFEESAAQPTTMLLDANPMFLFMANAWHGWRVLALLSVHPVGGRPLCHGHRAGSSVLRAYRGFWCVGGWACLVGCEAPEAEAVNDDPDRLVVKDSTYTHDWPVVND
eukprot:COSAG01_NODE_1205_length_11235_cov_324.494124_6_plen_108_part_00